MTTPTQGPIAFRVFNEIGIIGQLSRTEFERVMPAGLKQSQFMVLNHLTRLGGEWNQSRLANAFQVTKGAMTNTIQRLESRGFINVAPDPTDGRGKLISITDAGRAARAECLEKLTPVLAELLATFPEDEFAAALPFLERLRIHLDAKRD
jgi:DNA-binding MarR family transcriptional regulator